MTPFSLKTTLKYALKNRCPRCGEAPIFQSWNVLVERCAKCGLIIRAREPDTWFFMYMSTAGITGTFVLSMFLLAPPSDQFLGKWAIGAGALFIFVATTSSRKSLAIAIEYYSDCRAQFPRFPD